MDPEPTGTALLASRWVRQTPAGLLIVAARPSDAQGIAAAARVFLPDRPVLLFPAADCLPYDRARASAAVIGARIAVLTRLAGGAEAALVITTAEALLQRVPGRAAWGKRLRRVRVGRALDAAALIAALQGDGYRVDDRVDEPGEVALRGAVLDVWPGDAPDPVRITFEDGRVTRISHYQPSDQRSHTDARAVVLLPVSESDALGQLRGASTGVPPATLLDYLADAGLVLCAGAEARMTEWLGVITDAHAERRALLSVERRIGDATPPRPPAELYLTHEEWAAAVRARRVQRFATEGAQAVAPLPLFAAQPRPIATAQAAIATALRKGAVLVAGNAHGRRTRQLLQRLEKEGRDIRPFATWAAAVQVLKANRIATVPDTLPAGFAVSKLTVMTPFDLEGPQLRIGNDADTDIPAIACGDYVIHQDHGLGILRGLETVPVDGAPNDYLQLEYRGGLKLSVPVTEIDRVWQYGRAEPGLALDKLHGGTWPQRRQKTEQAINAMAADLAGAVRTARRARGRPVATDSPQLRQFAARFPYEPTPDQARAIADVMADLASGRRMRRLIFGDVGFGKTEIALRAGAAVAFSGLQVAVIAPTVVLAAQHAATFRRRFAGFDVSVALLTRATPPAEARQIRADIAAGRTTIVVGTQGVTAASVTFKRLGLIVVDEEHRFGTRQKDAIAARDGRAHVLSLSATPIPRTLQHALVGLRTFSMLTTAPSLRRPVQTLPIPDDPALIRDGLLREQRRGGQSFVVCPRIADLAPVQRRLQKLVPDLDIVMAHGKMPSDELDAAMLAFANGRSDVLLTTNIIESGLDIPNANTMFVFHPDRFGIAELHQLRGRIGRGARLATFFMVGAHSVRSDAARQRTAMLSAHSGRGAGFALAQHDLEARGAGDILGEAQSGHMRLLGSEYYEHLLRRALDRTSGASRPLSAQFTQSMHIPSDYIPEPDVRIEIYRRLSRLRGVDEAQAITDEVADRFGPPPPPVRQLLQSVAVRERCRDAGVLSVEAGPRGVALVVARRTGKRRDQAKRVRCLFKLPSRSASERIRNVDRALRRLRHLTMPGAPAS